MKSALGTAGGKVDLIVEDALVRPNLGWAGRQLAGGAKPIVRALALSRPALAWTRMDGVVSVYKQPRYEDRAKVLQAYR